MASYDTLKGSVQQVIKQNGQNEITGELLQQTLLAMINSLGAQFQFAGVATPSMDPGTPDQNVIYLAGPGTYPNFGTLIVPDGYIGVLSYNGTWELGTIAAPTIVITQILDGIVQLYDGETPIYPRTRSEAVFFGNDYTDTVKKVDVVVNPNTGKKELQIGNIAKLTVDKAPEFGSENLIESDGVAAGLQEIYNTIGILDISSFGAVTEYVNQTTWLIGNNSYKGIFIPCRAGSKFKITANSNYLTYAAFIKSKGATNGESVQFANGASRVEITRGTSEILVATTNTNYLWISTLRGGDNVMPANVEVLGIVQEIGNLSDLSTTEKSSIVSAINEVNESVAGMQDDVNSIVNAFGFPVDISTYPREQANITNAGLWKTDTSYYKAFFIPVNGAHSISIIANTQYGTTYAFVKKKPTANNEQVDFATGETKRTLPAYVPTITVLSIPSDAKFLWVLVYEGANVPPEYINVNGYTAEIQTLQEEAAEAEKDKFRYKIVHFFGDSYCAAQGEHPKIYGWPYRFKALHLLSTVQTVAGGYSLIGSLKALILSDVETYKYKKSSLSYTFDNSQSVLFVKSVVTDSTSLERIKIALKPNAGIVALFVDEYNPTTHKSYERGAVFNMDVSQSGVNYSILDISFDKITVKEPGNVLAIRSGGNNIAYVSDTNTFVDEGNVQHNGTPLLQCFLTLMDYLILEGTENDYGSTIGTYDPDDYSDAYLNALDESTFYGALERVISTACLKLPTTKIGWLITPNEKFSSPNYVEAVKNICDKYGIPYLDMTQACGRILNGATGFADVNLFTNFNREYYSVNMATGELDNHYGSLGYRLMYDYIDNFISRI